MGTLKVKKNCCTFSYFKPSSVYDNLKLRKKIRDSKKRSLDKNKQIFNETNVFNELATDQ